jgi:hypothetical protein
VPSGSLKLVRQTKSADYLLADMVPSGILNALHSLRLTYFARREATSFVWTLL